MNLDTLALLALDKVRRSDTINPRARAHAEHALCLLLETMFRTGDSRALLTTTEVNRYVGGQGHNATRVIDRLPKCGALIEITGTPAGEELRELLGGSSVHPSNSRVFQVAPWWSIEDGYPESADETRGSIEEGTGWSIEGQTAQQLHYSAVELVTTRNNVNVREYVAAMEPRAEAWKGNALGSREARVYGVVSAAVHPMTGGMVARELNVSTDNAKDLLRNLRKHGLVVQADSGPGWIPGPVNPSGHDPESCPECSPYGQRADAQPATLGVANPHRSTATAPLGSRRGSQRQDGPIPSAIVPESPELPAVSCSDCLAYLDAYGMPCPAHLDDDQDDGPGVELPRESSTPATPASPLRYRRDGSTVDTYPQTCEVFTHPDGTWIARCDPLTGRVPVNGRVYKPADTDYPHAVAHAYAGRAA